MIYCPSCGTANRDGSRFCNDCGADLSAVSGRRCPMCSSMNPVESTSCTKCGARLVPETGPLSEAEAQPEPVEGPRPEHVEGPPSLFERSSAEQEAETTDWLQQLRAGTAEEVPAAERPATPDAGPAEPAEKVPDWLKAIQPPEETEPRVPPMAWEDEAEIRGGPPSVTPDPYPAGEEEPDWLKRLRAASTGEAVPTEEPAMPPSPPTRPMEVPPAREVSAPPQEEEPEADWLERLRQTAPEEAPPAEMAEVAPPLFEEATAPPPSVETEPAEEIPDWLQGLRPEPERPPTPPVEAEAPPLAVEEEAEEELPDWLQRLRTEPEAPPMPAEAPPLAAEEEEIPDWLQGLRPESESLPPTPAEVEAPPLAMGEEEEVSDRLRELRPEPEAPPTPAEAPPWAVEEETEEEIPDWLQGLRPEPEEGPPSMPVEAEAPPLAVEEEGEEVSDWLRELRPEPEAPPTPAEVEAPPLAVEEEGEEELPDWLQRLRLEPEEEPPTPPVEAEAPPLAMEEEEEIPDWLQGLRLEPEEGPPTLPAEAEAPPLAMEEEEEIPDWLRGLRLEPEEEPPTLPVEAEAPPLAVEAELGEEIPEWLKELGPIPEPEGEAPVFRETEEAQKQIVATEESEEIVEEMPPPEAPEWVRELGPAPEVEEPAFEEAEGVPPDKESPEWLRELGPPQLAAEEEAVAPPAALDVEAPTSEVPDWLKELGPPVSTAKPAVEEEAPLPPPPPATEKVSPPVADKEALEVEGLARAEIPAWLQELQPRGETEEGTVKVPGVAEVVETTGLLAGIPGVLPAEPIVSKPHKAPAPTAAVTVGPEQANLFIEIIAQGSTPVAEALAPKRARIWGGVLHGFIYLLIALAVIIPLYGVGDWFGQAELPTGAVMDFYNTVQSLEPDDSVVLLAFDYDPFTAAEMDRLAEPVIWHLMDRNVNLMAVSLLPTGPAVAGNLLDRVAGEHNSVAEEHDVLYQYGQNYVNLGYIPGQIAAPSELASDLRTLVPQDYRQGKSLGQLPATQKVHSIQDVSLIIEFAAQQRTLQWWLEQVGSQYQVEIMAAVSAAVEPTAKPYHNSGQLVGLISGLPSAVQYETKTDKWPSLYIASVDAQSVAHLAIVALIFLGSLASLISARRK